MRENIKFARFKSYELERQHQICARRRIVVSICSEKSTFPTVNYRSKSSVNLDDEKLVILCPQASDEGL